MIAHNKPSLSQLETHAVETVMKSGWVAEGKQVASFENDFCQLYKLPEGCAVAVSSGSAALYLALIAVNAKKKLVALPTYSCSSLENATLLAGASPRYVDCASNSFNINQQACQGADIIIQPHLFGIPSLIEKSRTATVIEDCAQSIGALLNGQLVGLQSEVGIFSFYATKLMTSAGQGGMIISKNKKMIDFIRDFIHFDCKNDGKIRFNFQMTDVQASVGRIQLIRLFDEFIPKREDIFKRLMGTGLPFFDANNSNTQAVRFRALLRSKQPYQLMDFLRKEKIKSIIPVEKNELLGIDHTDKESALFNTQNWLSIPCYPELSNGELQHIQNSLIKARHLL